MHTAQVIEVVGSSTSSVGSLQALLKAAQELRITKQLCSHESSPHGNGIYPVKELVVGNHLVHVWQSGDQMELVNERIPVLATFGNPFVLGNRTFNRQCWQGINVSLLNVINLDFATDMQPGWSRLRQRSGYKYLVDAPPDFFCQLAVFLQFKVEVSERLVPTLRDLPLEKTVN